MTREVFEANIARMRGQLLAIARSKLPQDEAEDAVQNAVLSAWKHIAQLRNDDAFHAWIKQILLNECARLLREQNKRREIDAALQKKTESLARESEISLGEALDEMKPEERELLMLHHEQGYSIAELSKRIGKSEDVVKMRLYRARKRLHILLISLLILLLSMAVAVGTGLLDVQWFFENRRAIPSHINTDHRSDISVSYSGRYLVAEAVDAVWDMDTLTLHFTYSLTGVRKNAAIVHNGDIGVDGERMDHIWVDDRIVPVEQWADGKKVQTYYLDGWRMNGVFINGSEDSLPDGKGAAFLASFRLGGISPDEYASLLSDEGKLCFESDVFIHDYDTGELVEKGVLTMNLTAPTANEWRIAYEEYDR